MIHIPPLKHQSRSEESMSAKLTISHIVAISENRIIGRDGGMPWHIPEDFKFFKATTMGHAMIMGRKTWDSIGRALPGRLTIVVTRASDFKAPENVIIKKSIPDAIAYCESVRSSWGDECFVVGGGDIYRQTLPLASKIYLTIVHKNVDGDTSYPELPAQFTQKKNRGAHGRPDSIFFYNLGTGLSKLNPVRDVK